jgi:hypothetical protein
MGKNRPYEIEPIIENHNHISRGSDRYDTIGTRAKVDYTWRYLCYSIVFSFAAMILWNNVAKDLFNLPTVTFLQAWSLFVLVSLVRVAYFGLQFCVIRPQHFIRFK